MTQYYKQTLEEALTKYGSRVGIIYRIYCTRTGVSYVGQTRDVSRKLNFPRIKSHYAALKKGCHPCKELQAAWDTSSGESIKDEILEIVAPVDARGIDSNSKMLQAEKRCQEQYRAANGQLAEKDWHYRLKAEEIRTLRESGIINNATLVYFVLKLKNPWCDRPLKINPLELAVEWEIPESSVYEAIAKLKEAEVIHINEAEIIISWSTNSQQSLLSDNSESFQDSRMDSEIPECSLKNQNGFQDPRMNSEISENCSLELSCSNGSSEPHTIQTYSIFINSLSESERENFEKFVRVEWKKLTAKKGEPGEEIISLERFLAREEDLKNWHQKFLDSPAGKEAKKKAIATGYDWRIDDRFNDWIWEAFNRGYEWVHESEQEREQRKAFYDWTFATNAFEGVCL
jgi:hypothetical protein